MSRFACPNCGKLLLDDSLIFCNRKCHDDYADLHNLIERFFE